MPSAFGVAVPTWQVIVGPRERESPSTSPSLASTSTTMSVLSFVAATSGAAIGVSLTGTTVTVSCPVALPPFPSSTV